MTTLDAGRILIREPLHAGAGDVVHRGTLASDAEMRLLITLTGPHATPVAALPIVPSVEGIVVVEWIGSISDPAAPYRDALVERLPAGRAASERAPLGPSALPRLGAALARVTAAVHATGSRLDGVRPELVSVDDDGVTPSSSASIASRVQSPSTAALSNNEDRD